MADDDGETKFRGLMKSLNLDESQLPTYPINFGDFTIEELAPIKRLIEDQLGLLFDLLHNQYHADMDSNLTVNGFPRSDIDVMNVRLLRVKIIRLRNDNKALLKVMETKLEQAFAQHKSDAMAIDDDEPVMVEHSDAAPSPKKAIEYTIPFARVTEVAPEGPAYALGLRDDDEIVVFDGDIHAANHDKLQALVKRVAPGRKVSVVVQRGSDRVDLTLTPNKWQGRGILGCRVLPL